MKARRTYTADYPPHERTAVRSDRKLSVADTLELRSRYSAGWPIDVLARNYGVSRRTAYRYTYGEIREMELDGWVAVFLIRPGYCPSRIARWHRVREDVSVAA